VIVLKKKLRHYIPALSLGCGWILGIAFFYLAKILDLETVASFQNILSFSAVCSALTTQSKLFILVCLSGFSMLSGIIPAAIVFIRSLLASFSCASVYNAFSSSGDFSVLRYVAFAIASALICVFLTSSARLAGIFYTKVPHGSPENILDYLARQLFTLGFALITMLIYFTVCKLV
jgi:hypothetical protein